MAFPWPATEGAEYPLKREAKAFTAVVPGVCWKGGWQFQTAATSGGGCCGRGTEDGRFAAKAHSKEVALEVQPHGATP